MKMRDSGMPEEGYWETLLDVPLILDRLGIDARLGDVVELGCGYGTFTLPIAQRIHGTLTSVDIEQQMVDRTLERAAAEGVQNVQCRLRDVMIDGFGIEASSRDAVLLFNILHCEQPVALLAEATRVARPSGWVFVIHWRHDYATPRGPALNIRPHPHQIMNWAEQTGGLELAGEVIDLPPWHFGVRFRRKLLTET